MKHSSKLNVLNHIAFPKSLTSQQQNEIVYFNEERKQFLFIAASISPSPLLISGGKKSMSVSGTLILTTIIRHYLWLPTMHPALYFTLKPRAD